MLARTATILKWTLYAAAAALCLLIQGALLQRITVWGVIPFLYPLLAAIPATYESPRSAAIFALCLGVLCDLLLPEPIPCLFTLLFPLIGLCASLLSQSLLPAGFFCSLTAGTAAFLIIDGFRCFALWMTGRPAWQAGGFLMVREFSVTAPLILPMTLLFRGVARRARRLYD